MSSLDKHIEQYRHNKSFLDNGIKDKDQYSDWTITVIFYCGVHLVEAMLAKVHQDSEDHSDRRLKLKYISNRAKFEDEYFDLYNLSRQARYDCIGVGESQILGAQIDLDAILSAYRTFPAS